MPPKFFEMLGRDFPLLMDVFEMVFRDFCGLASPRASPRFHLLIPILAGDVISPAGVAGAFADAAPLPTEHLRADGVRGEVLHISSFNRLQRLAMAREFSNLLAHGLDVGEH